MSVLANDLLEQAKFLSALDKHKPKQANLRRAVSAAYYALFHFLVAEASIFVVDNKFESKSLRQLVSRCFEHGCMKEASKAFTLSTSKPMMAVWWQSFGLDKKPSHRLQNAQKLTNVAQTFADLQEERHRADYDIAQNFTRQEVQVLIQRVELAMHDWTALRKGDVELTRFFALGLVFWKMWAKR